MDDCGFRVASGDVNGDGTSDLLVATQGDGPSNGRTNAGEVIVVFGRAGLPSEVRFANGEYDMIVYGAELADQLAVIHATTDVNDDGLREIALVSRNASPTKLPMIYLISPFDVDGDGHTQLEDNCPLVYNPEQTDSVGNGRGDACRLDWDGDGVPDAEDCAPSNAKAGRPPEITGVRFVSTTVTTLTWDAQSVTDTYDVSRGDLPLLGAGDYGTCQNARDANRADTTFADGDRPGTGRGFFYLVRGRDEGCGGVGSWGRTSAGQERVNTNPLRCP